jgi:hypothetical protein
VTSIVFFVYRQGVCSAWNPFQAKTESKYEGEREKKKRNIRDGNSKERKKKLAKQQDGLFHLTRRP